MQKPIQHDFSPYFHRTLSSMKRKRSDLLSRYTAVQELNIGATLLSKIETINIVDED